MKLLKELLERYGDYDMTVGDYTLKQEEDYEDDNVKIWHTVYRGNERLDSLDHSPYEFINQDTFTRYLKFYERNDRFPSRKDTGRMGPLSNKDLAQIVP